LVHEFEPIGQTLPASSTHAVTWFPLDITYRLLRGFGHAIEGRITFVDVSKQPSC